VGVAPAYGKVVLTTDVSDYTTGTFTPTFAGTGTVGAWTYSQQIGRYTQIGNRVFFNIVLQATARGVAPTGNATIAGLPITSDATANNLHAVAIEFDQITLSATNTFTSGRVPPSTTRIDLIEVLGTAPATAGLLAATGMTATAVMHISGHYMV
jgi:hypothetical protein